MEFIFNIFNNFLSMPLAVYVAGGFVFTMLFSAFYSILGVKNIW